MLEQVRHTLERYALLGDGDRVGIGVSGGIDSIVLLDVMLRLGYVPLVCHVNYQMRGAASDEDERFVQARCAALGIECYSHRVDGAAYARAKGYGIQEAARTLRYQYFSQVAEENELEAVAVAHHLDDQVETVLLNLLRGTGPEGVAGMSFVRTLHEDGPLRLIRPFLAVRRAEIEDYARAHRLPWRDDESNLSLKYQRNILRQKVFPVLSEHFGSTAIVNIARSATHMRAYLDDAFYPTLSIFFEKIARREEQSLDLDLLHTLTPVWRRRVLLEALKRWFPEEPRNETQAQALEALCNAQPGRRHNLRGGVVWRERSGLYFSADAGCKPVDEEIAITPGQTVILGEGMLRIEMLEQRPDSVDMGTARCVVVDADTLAFPLMARRWRPGDRFQPLGMEGKKKVSDFLTDEKVPTRHRADTWVLCSNNTVVWVVGLRLDHRVRVQERTTRVAKFTYIETL